MKQTGVFVWMIVVLVISAPVFCLPDGSVAAQKYEFERMWPVLEQPWYFHFPEFIAVDAEGNVYISEQGSHSVKKFTASGTYITGWGGFGKEEGKFDWPIGITIDSSGNVYVADSGNHRIQKFTSSGEFITQWGSQGDGDGQFYRPQGVAVDIDGTVYVADTWNHRIQKFKSDGLFKGKWGQRGSGDGEFLDPMAIAINSESNIYVTDCSNNRIQIFTAQGNYLGKWGSEGSGDGEFDYPYALAIDVFGNVYVVDGENHRIQVFDDSGGFLRKWGSYGGGDGQLDDPRGVSVDRFGNVYVGDMDNCRVQKFSATGAFISSWGSDGDDDGQFNGPSGVTRDGAGNVYVVDEWNHRIQKFSETGTFITSWGRYGSGDGEFNRPTGIAIDAVGNVYVAERGNDRIQKFSPSGAFIDGWGGWGSENGKLDDPMGIAVDAVGNVYVAEWDNHRIQKFSSSGVFLSKWGLKGSGDGEFSSPCGVAVDSSGNIYVADWGNHRIQKFTSAGGFISKWGVQGNGEGALYHPVGVAVDALDNIFVVDTWNYRIQEFTSKGEYITTIGSMGSAPGLMGSPLYVSVGRNGEIFVTESHNNRVQVFTPATETTVQKAIIVAGSGPYEGNILWSATQMCANYAFRALNFQGYSGENIFYLSANNNSDTDNDGIPDADGNATNANLEYALKYWAQDADNLLLYMVGHGRDGAFVMGEFENLQASDLDSWLDYAQGFIPNAVALVYDGCRSGSFVPFLTPPTGKTRMIAASAAADEAAIFEADGGLSFGYQFFSHLFGGARFYNAFVHAKKSVEGAYDFKQNPELEVDGNGTPNDKSDKELAQAIKVGKERSKASDLPRIQEVSPAQTLALGETAAIIDAKNVNGDGVQEVFAVIKPPETPGGSADQPVTNLPTLPLTKVEGGTGDFDDYSGTYEGFTQEGVYHIAVFARDKNSILSLPLETSVIVPASSSCLTVAGDLSIRVPCAEHGGNKYGFTLDFYQNPDDPGGLYWKLVMATLSAGETGDCIPIGLDLSMPLSCVCYNGTRYGFTLRFYGNPKDTNGLYWKLDGSTLVAK